MGTTLIITMGLTAIGTAVTEKVLVAMGKVDMAEWVRLAGTSLVGAQAIGLAIDLLMKVKKTVV